MCQSIAAGIVLSESPQNPKKKVPSIKKHEIPSQRIKISRREMFWIRICRCQQNVTCALQRSLHEIATNKIRQEMLPLEQQTVSRDLQFSGPGLHTGRQCQAVIKPANADTGIVFRCPSRKVEVAACWSNVLDSSLSTMLSCPRSVVGGVGRQKLGIWLQRFGLESVGNWMTGCYFATVEHLLAALSAVNVDNAVIELTNGEVPIMDGSALPFMNSLESTGAIKTIPGSKVSAFRVLQRVDISTPDGRHVSIEPLPSSSSVKDDIEIHVEIDFGDRISEGARGSQTFSFTKPEFGAKVAAARTFCFYEDLEMLQAMNLARGGSLSNAVVYRDGKVVNAEGLRYPDEAARHKALDALGDLRLGGRLIGRYVGIKPGHALNHRLLVKLFGP